MARVDLMPLNKLQSEAEVWAVCVCACVCACLEKKSDENVKLNENVKIWKLLKIEQSQTHSHERLFTLRVQAICAPLTYAATCVSECIFHFNMLADVHG